LDPKCKMHTGQRIKLFQVTGKAQLKGFINLPIFFETDDGPVRIDVEAYVVKGMQSSVILGNDFSQQYNFSVIRDQGTLITLGDSRRTIPAVKSDIQPRLYQDGST